MKKYLILLSIFTTGFALADDENYDGQTVIQNFNGQSLKYSSWVGSTIKESNFIETKLNEANFSNSKISTVNFSNANLTDSVFDSAQFSGNIIFNGAIIKGASFTGTNFIFGGYSNVSFNNATLNNANFSNAILASNGRTVNFDNADLTNVNFSNTSFISGATSVSFKNADLTNANFTNTIFSNVISFTQYKEAYSVEFNVNTFNGTNFTDAVFACSSIGNGIPGNKGNACSAVDLSNKEFINVNFTNAIFSAYYYLGEEPVVDFTNSVFKNCIFHGAVFGIENRAGVNLSDMNLSYTDFAEAKFYNVNLNNSDISHSNFSFVKGLKSSQLSQTVNYKNKDMNGIKFDGLDLTNWIIREQNLQNTSFVAANLSSANVRYADLRGANLTDTTGLDTLKTQNTIWNDGEIKNFAMESEDDSFSIRKYEPVSIGGATISAKLNASSAISGGAVLTLNKGAEFEVVNNSTLTLSKDSAIVINTDLNSSTIFTIADGSSFKFEDGAKLVINLEDFDWSELNSETLKFSAMNWNDVSKIIGIEDLVKGEDIVLNVNGKEYAYSWTYEITDSGMLVVLPEPSTYAAVIGAIALAFTVYRRRK